MRLTKIAISVLTMCLVLIFTFGGTVNAEEISSITKVPDCLNLDKEKEKQKSMFPDGLELSINQPQEIVFDDGSSIVYTLNEEIKDEQETDEQETDEQENALGVDPITTSTVSHTYSVTKEYEYYVAIAVIKLYADITWGTPTSRSVTIKKEYTSLKGTWVTYADTGDSIVTAVGTGNTKAVAEAYGQFTLRAPQIDDYFTRSYRIQLIADPADSSKVTMDDLLD